ncbi:MAG: uroporphyrinogen decarboxylase family protein [Planctomycetota bacterium]
MSLHDRSALGDATRDAIARAAARPPMPPDEGETLRERFRKTMHYETPDRLPNFEFGYWAETLPAWHEQGLPREIDKQGKAYEYFGIEDTRGAGVGLGLGGDRLPEETIEETDDYRVYRDGIGVVLKQPKDGHSTIPQHISFPLKDAESWKWFRDRLGPEDRVPEDMPERAKKLNRAEVPIVAYFGSLMGWIRNWMGFEEFAMATIERPEFLEEMMEYITRTAVTVLGEVAAAGLRPDAASGWEDICFNSGPICGVKFFEEVAVPRYARIAEVLHGMGCDIMYTDCDGNISELVPGYLEAGVNCMFPVEVNGGSDPVALRKKHGRDLRFMGGVDKMKLAAGPKAIEAELMRLLPVVEDGGFIPHCDHRCPPTVKLADYKFYLDLKRHLFACGKREKRY